MEHPGGITEDELRRLMKQRIAAAGGRNEWCEENGLTFAQVYHFLVGEAHPRRSIVEALGYDKQVVYIPLRG